MANQVGATREGIRYQDLYCWCEILLLLDDQSSYEQAYLEHPDACSVDDLVLTPKEATEPTKYIQLKWRVTQSELCSFESLTKVRSGEKSWLQQLYTSWKKLRERGTVEILFVSNWPADPELGRYIRSRQGRISDDFFGASSGSMAGKARALWSEHLEISELQLKEFVQDLRLQVPTPSIGWLENLADERMGRLGLRMGPNPRAVALDQISSWIEQGGENKTIGPQHLRRLVRERDLLARPETEEIPHDVERVVRQTPEASLWIHGWSRQGFDLPPTVELDWTEHFDITKRRIPAQEVWSQVLFPDLVKAKTELSQHRFIDFRGKLPLTALLAVGHTFSEVADYTFRTAQPTRGEIFLWRSNEPPTGRKFITEEKTSAGTGSEVIVAFSIVGDAQPATQPLQKRLGGRLKACIFAVPDSGWGGDAIASGGDATAFAHQAKELLKRARSHYQATKIHLIVYTPASFCLFLGQKLSALGTIVTYESTGANDYQESVILETR